MNPANRSLREIEEAISRSVAQRVLRLLRRIPRTEWRNDIIPFPAIYKKAGYVMKLNRKTTQNVLRLLAFRGRIEFVNFHGVILRDAFSHGTKKIQGRLQPVPKSAKLPTGC